MKKLLTIIFTLFVFTTISFAQFTSVKSGGKWWYPSTWSNDPNATAYPDSLDDVIVMHEINIDGNGNCKNLTIQAGGKIHNGTINVYGSIQNYGEIVGRSEWYGMKVKLRGNLKNAGYYDADTDFNGTLDQTIYSIDTLRLGYSHDNNPDSKIISEQKLLLGYTNLFMQGAEFEFKDTLEITNTVLDGGVYNGNGNVLKSLGGTNVIGWTGIEGFGPTYTNLTNLVLTGTHYIYAAGNDKYGLSMLDGVINNGSIINKWMHTGGATKFYVESDFVNNGFISEQQDGLSIDFENCNFINNGGLSINNLNFAGTCDFSVVDSIALGSFTASDSNTIVTVTSGDILFKDRTVDVNFNGGKLILPSNGKFYTTYLWYNKLRNIEIEANNSEIAFAHIEGNTVINNPKIRYFEGQSDILLTGNVEIVEMGTLTAYSDSYPRISIESNLENYGTIRNHQSSGSLYLTVTGNILHDGKQWSNAETKLIGTEDQHILIPNDSSWTGKVILDPILEASSYVWQKDGVDIPGATSRELVFNNGLTPSDYGEYQCIVGFYNSRKIYIGTELPPAFEITDVVIKNVDSSSTMVMWKTSVPATGFIFYAENDASSGYPLEAMEPNELVTEHSLLLEDLTFGSTYYFIIDQNDEGWTNNVRSEEFSFVAGDFTLGALAINSIVDVPEDQGGWVYVNFDADIMDAVGNIKLYGVWEWMNEEWVSVGSVPATQDSAYTFLAHTYKDSTDKGIYWSKFYISAHSTDPLVFFNSKVDSGYSIDNLAPQAPEGLNIDAFGDGNLIISWNRNIEEDLNYYCVYRNDEKIGTVTDTVFVDEDARSGIYIYKITAMDFNGNESEFSETKDITVDVENESELPTEYSLSQNYPNPFNPSTVIEFAIPTSGNVSLKIFNSIGEEVAELVNREMNAGYHSVNFDARNLSSGIYFYRITAGASTGSATFTQTNKMILLR